MQLKFWNEVFLTTTYLINMLPSKAINNDTPLHRLLGTSSNYFSLRVFGCACRPNLHPYNKRELALHSQHRVFCAIILCIRKLNVLMFLLGVFIRDVFFVEGVFPFKELHPNSGSSLHKEFLLCGHSLGNIEQGG
jgi:hypothetical protein